jgi:hypothetical protein
MADAVMKMTALSGCVEIKPASGDGSEPIEGDAARAMRGTGRQQQPSGSLLRYCQTSDTCSTAVKESRCGTYLKTSDVWLLMTLQDKESK